MFWYVSLFVCLKMMTLDVERFSDVLICFTICFKMMTLYVERFSDVLVCFTICLFENDDFGRRTFQ